VASAYFVYGFFMQVGVDQNMVSQYIIHKIHAAAVMVLIVNTVTHPE
jgi:hypothetical protein